MKKIVELGKKGLLNNDDTTVDLSRTDPKHTGRLSYKYTNTKSLKISEDTLISNRIIAQDRNDPRSKCFHVLRTKVLQLLNKKGWNTLGITAPTQGAGKSFISANLAISLAMEGNHSVLLVDMDLSKPSIHTYFGFEPEFGFEDYLAGTAGLEQTMVHPGIDRLVLLPGSKKVRNSSEHLSTPLVKNLVNELKNRYEKRLILFDLPPALQSDDVMIFLPYIDCSLMVIESGKNTPKDVEKSLEVIANHPLLGTILNKSEKASGGFGYS